MAKAPRPWIVTRHDPIEELDDNLWAVNGDIPGSKPAAGLHRRMHIVRLDDGRLLFNNAVPVDDATLAKIKAWGTPAFLVVPHHLHAMDAHAFREKLGLAAYTGARAPELVARILPVAGSLAALPQGDCFAIEPLASSRFGEVAITVRSGPRLSLLVNDVLTNLRAGAGFAGWLFGALRFTGTELMIAPIPRMRAFRNKELLRHDLLRLADLPGLARVVPCHGLVVSDDAAGAIRRAVQAI